LTCGHAAVRWLHRQGYGIRPASHFETRMTGA
jgi:hypothetical protein